jgi:hypothetical protein
MPDRLADAGQNARNKAIFRAFCEVMNTQQVVSVKFYLTVPSLTCHVPRLASCHGPPQTKSLAQARSSFQRVPRVQ